MSKHNVTLNPEHGSVLAFAINRAYPNLVERKEQKFFQELVEQFPTQDDVGAHTFSFTPATHEKLCSLVKEVKQNPDLYEAADADLINQTVEAFENASVI